jgi:micrococcal nuclease
MRRATTLILLAVVLALQACGDGGQLDRLAAGERAKVAEVVDGDEIRLSNGLDVRLAGIDAPWADEPGGTAARAYLNALVLGREVQLFYGGARRDKRGRALAQVRLTDGRLWVEGAILSDGWARVRTFADNRALAAPMLEDEAHARVARRGLWAMPAYEVRLPQEVSPDTRGLQIVEGRVLTVTPTRSGLYLDFTPDKKGFAVLVAPHAAGDLAAAGIAAETLKGRLIRVRGVISYGETMHIDHPELIEVIKEK